MYLMCDLLTLYLYNQSDGLRHSEHFSLVIRYFNYIFHYNYCNATLHYYAAIYYAAFSLSLFTLYYNYVSYFVVKCDRALLLLRQGTC